MAETLKGKAAIWGTGSFATTGIIINSSVSKAQSIDHTIDSDNEQLTDENGEVCAEAFFNAKQTLNIDVIPIDATNIAGARTNTASMTVTPGTIVTIATEDDITAIDALATHAAPTKYTLLSASTKRTNRGYLVVSMSLRQYLVNDVTPTMT